MALHKCVNYSVLNMSYTFKLQDSTEYTLTFNPDYGFSEAVVDNTVRTKTDGSYVMTLARTTKDIYKYKLVLSGISDTDRVKVEAVEASCGGADWFYWTHPVTAAIKTVRFSTRPTYKRPYYDRSVISFELEDI